MFERPPVLLREVLTSNSGQGKHFRKNLRQYIARLAMASFRSDFVSRVPGVSKNNPTVSVHGKRHNEIGALEPRNVMVPRYTSVYMHNTEHATSNRKDFYSGLREDLLSELALMLEEKNNHMKSFISLGNLTQSNGIPDDMKLVIHAHEKTVQDIFETTMYQKQAT